MYQRLRDNRLGNVSDLSRTGLNLPQLLFYSRELEVTEPKDKIITMFSLATATERIEMLDWIDYNLSTQEISIAVAKYCLEKQNNHVPKLLFLGSDDMGSNNSHFQPFQVC